MSQSDLRLHFGVGKSQTIDVIEVKWPTTQEVERFTAVKVNQILADVARQRNCLSQPCRTHEVELPRGTI